MRLCLMLEGQEGVGAADWIVLAQAAEKSGLEGVFCSDHYRSIVRGEPAGGLDTWSMLAATAASTERIRLGSLVSPVTFRHGSVLAKNVVTVDHISGGRVELGIGAGWYEPEHDAYGFRFGTARERVDELGRQLEVIVRQWRSADDVWPKPVQDPGPPIIVGGSAGPRTVRAAVRFADEYNTAFPTVEEARDRRTAVDRAAAEAEREPLRFSIMTGCLLGRDRDDVRERLGAWRAATGLEGEPQLTGTVDEIAELLSDYAAVGVNRAMLQHLLHEDVEMVALLGELAAAVGS